MKRQINFKLGILCTILVCALVIPALGQSTEGDKHQQWRAEMAKACKLNPEKETQCKTVADKYMDVRKGIFASLKKNQEELSKALAATKPDEAKVKDLVKAINAAQDELLTTFKTERNELMALLTPIQQGRYLELWHKWRMEMYQKKAGEQKGEKK